MFQRVDLHDFCNAFKAIRPDNFSWEGLEVLFDYFQEYEEATGETIELDVIGICGDYSEDSADDIVHHYDIDLPDFEDEDEDERSDIIHETVREYLELEGMLVGEVSGGFVYRQF